MRRFIAYISLALTVLISVGIAFTPVFASMKPGREFTHGNELVYRITESEDPEKEIDSSVVEKVAAEMKSRLETYKIEDYSIRIEGNDTVRVGLSVNNETKLNYISNYLCFNGKNFSLAGAEEETRVLGDKIFVDCEAYIVRKEDIIPYVIIPVSDTAAVKTLIEAVEKKPEPEPSNSIQKANEGGEGGGGEEKKDPNIFLWANWAEGDTYEIAQKDKAVTGQKIICSFLSSDIWYKDNLKEGEEPKELQFLCGYAKPDSGEYDATKLRQANELATYLCNMFNAPEFKYSDKNYSVENLFVTQSKDGTKNNTIYSDPTAESLLVYGTTVNVRMSATFIATLVAIVVVFLILVMFYRVGAIGILANTLGSTFLAYTIFISMGATFNIAAVVGGLLVATTAIFLGALYMNKLKEEVYKGRALRKANQEAMKKINMPSIDVAVVMLFAGLMMFFLGGHALKPLGIMLFFGGIMTLLMTQVIFRLMMWLLTNSTSMQTSYKLLNIDEKLVPNIMKEEKSTYVAPYENTNFTSKKKVVGIISGIVALASIVGICVFGGLNGSPLNVSNATKDTTQVYTSIKNDNPTLSTEDSFKNDILKHLYVNGKALEYSDVSLTTRDEYDYETDITTKYTYFVTSINNTFGTKDKFQYEIEGEKADAESLSDAINYLVYSVEGESSYDYVETEEKVSHETITTPNQGFVALACAITIVGSAIYFAFRYRPSRGVAALVISSLATLITYGFFVLTRIQTTTISALILPIAAVISLVGCIAFFEKEKALKAENKVKGEIKPETKRALMMKASSLCAVPLFITTIIGAYIAINYFGFGYKSFAVMFAGMLFAVVISALFITTLLGPVSEGFAKLFSKIKLPKIKIERKKKQRIKLQNKPKTSEPEETIFIGIND